MTQPGKTYDPSRYAASPPQNRDLAQQRHQEIKENAREFNTNRSASTKMQKGVQRNNSAAAAAALGQDGPPNSKPLLDFQTSFVYGSTYENSRGREAFENSILKPLTTIGNPPLPADATLAETREFWKARFGEAGILVRDDTSRRRGGGSRSVHIKPTQTRAFEEWRAEKLRQRSEELARQEALRKEEEERAARASRESARAVKSWERQKKKQAREARIEVRRAQRAKRREAKKKRAKQQKAEKELEEQTILALQSAAAESAQARAARAAARAREREEQRARAARNEEAFQEWIEAKKRQQAAEARRRAEKERIRREVATAERERRWAKKDVVLAYTGALFFGRDGLSVSLASRDEAKSQSSLD